MTQPSDQPERRPHREHVSLWRFALFLFGLAGFAVLTWHELPRLMSWGDRPPTATDAAGDVGIDTRMAPPGRISNLPEYVVQYFTSVGFAPGSAALTASGRQSLDKVMDKGDTLRAYLVEVAAFADAAGAEASDTRLSAARADTVIAYLARVRLVPMQRIVNATGLDTSRAGDALLKVKGGQRAKNRRVDVRIVVIRRGRTR
jgi:outer membrane protein OmpA-like peptidoglycan-associated protein